jgi:hypothetical protein
MVGIGAPNELQPKLRIDVSEVKAGESLAQHCAHRYSSPSHVIPASGFQQMHHAVRRLVVVAVGALCAAACGDTQRLPAMGSVFSDTLIVYALSGTDISFPTALNVQELAVVRATGVFDYEIAFDIDATGKAVLYPMELLVAEEATFRKVGMQRLTVPFESLTSAPRTGYVYDQPMTLAAGESIAIEAAVPCQYPYPQVVFAKLMVDSVSAAKRAIYFHAVSDPSCGFRSLVPGELPKR